MIKRDLRFGSLGSGILVFDVLHQENGDYEKIAHIRHNRVIKYYKDLGTKDLLSIEHYALFANPRVCQTKDQKVFSTPPLKAVDTDKYRITVEYYNSGKIYHVRNADGNPVTDDFHTYLDAALALIELCHSSTGHGEG